MPKVSVNDKLNPTATTVLKGLAISAVVVIHYFSLIKQSPFWNNSAWQVEAVFIDRLMRLSVPLFVALSGYGLSQKYQKKINFKEFFSNRIFKLLIPYFAWSIFYFFFAWIYYRWQMVDSLGDFVSLLILGRVDYHLYFIPMIFQLYLIFPALFFCWQKWPKITLILGFFSQITWFWFFSYLNHSPFNLSYFQGDAEQYFWSINWIWYFILGFELPKIIAWLKRQALISKLSVILFFLLTYYAQSQYSLWQLNQGMNALNVLRFTQYPTLIFATAGIIVFAYIFSQIKNFPKPFIWLGKNSFWIYLSHYLWLRLLFQFFLVNL